jgi:hypothetical protein
MRLRLMVLLLLAPLAKGQQQMSHEEQVVRTTYAKLSYATQIKAVVTAFEDSLTQPPTDNAAVLDRIAKDTVTFQFTSIQVGDFADIAKTAYGDLVTKPNGENILSIATGFWTYTTDEPKETKTATAYPAWTGSPILAGEDWTVPFALAMQKVQEAGQEDTRPYKRYAAISVTVTFHNQTRSYKSLFEFGHDTQGKELILPVDTVIGGPALAFFFANSVYPAVLFEPGLRKVPFVAQWLRSNAAVGIGSGQVSCNLQSLKCSVPQADVTRALSYAKRNGLFMDAAFHPKAAYRLFFQTATCSSHNTSKSSGGATLPDTGDHITGGHNMSYGMAEVCTYTNGNNTNNTCDTSCNDGITAVPNESGQVISACHVAQISQLVGGSGSATGGGANCNASIAMGVKACLFCACSLSFSVSGSGTGVSISSDGFYTVQQNDSNSCAPQAQPTPTPTPPPPAPTPTPGCASLPLASTADSPSPSFAPIANFTTPPLECDPNDPTSCPCTPPSSPIIVDLTGDGFFLTSAANGVKFDIANSGTPIQIAWTANANNAFLVLDRNGNGVINSGAEMFGNFTPQPSSTHPNGFLALAAYDDPMNGGNGDGIIDAHDQVFSKLRLWVDANHDGISQPEELHTLPELGIFAISLDYSLSERTDEYGNVFRYKTHVNKGLHGPADVGKTAYDVFLMTQ